MSNGYGVPTSGTGGCTLEYGGKTPEQALLSQVCGEGAGLLLLERRFVPRRDTAGGAGGILAFGDNLQLLGTFCRDEDPLIAGRVRGKVKLVYIDPPFSTEKEFRAGAGQKAYADRTRGAQFVEFMRQRLILLRELLAEDGWICVHLDYRKKHYIRVVMDEIFGEENFRNEIAVSRVKKSIRERRMVRKLNEEFDTLLLYARSEASQLLPPTRAEVREERWHGFGAPELRSGMDYELFGHRPPANRHWIWEEARARRAEQNYAEYLQMHQLGETLGEYCERTGSEGDFLRAKPSTGKPEYYIPASGEALCNNLWNDICAYSFSNTYPTEKSEALLARVIEMTTREGELVLDCFAGSGTAIAAAEKLGRRWIGCDMGKLALLTIQRRMLQLGGSKDIHEPKRRYRREAGEFSVLSIADGGDAACGGDADYHLRQPISAESRLVRDEDGLSLEISGLRSAGGTRQGLETLSLVLIDDRPQEDEPPVFGRRGPELVWCAKPKGGVPDGMLRIPLDSGCGQVRVICVDLYGNESDELLTVGSR